MAVSWRALVPAFAVPILFVHVRYQPKVHVDLGSTTAGIELSDVAVLAVVVAALASGIREGWAPLRAARRIWVLAGLFLGLVVVATFYGRLTLDHYRFAAHLVTTAKFCEYGLLAPALPLLLRRRGDAMPLLWTVAAWSGVATSWGLLQFSGLVNEFEGRRPLQREPSFVGIHDFAALSGAALSLGLAVLLVGPRQPRARALGVLGGVSGAAGLVLSGAVTGMAGVALAAVLAAGVALARRTVSTRALLAGAAVVLAAAGGTILMRGGEIERAIRNVGIGSPPTPSADVASYTQRSLLAYIGVRIFLDHPLFGVGWQASEEPEISSRYLAATHRRFPDSPPIAFPSPAHEWGVQNFYLQTLADLGLVGGVVVLALFVYALALGVRTALRAPPNALTPFLAGSLWVLVAGGVWNGLGLVAGIPEEALTWLGFGLVGAAAAWAADDVASS